MSWPAFTVNTIVVGLLLLLLLDESKTGILPLIILLFSNLATKGLTYFRSEQNIAHLLIFLVTFCGLALSLHDSPNERITTFSNGTYLLISTFLLLFWMLLGWPAMKATG